MLTKQLAQEHLNKTPTFANQVTQIKQLMITSGLHNLLIEAAKPRVIGQQHAHHDKLSASEASRSIGYFEALSDIMNFAEKYLVKPQTQAPATPRADYGAKQTLVNKKVITESEALGIK